MLKCCASAASSLSLPTSPSGEFSPSLFQLKLHDDSARSPALSPPTASPTIAVQLQRVPTWGAHRGLLFIPTVSSPSSLVQALSSASGYVMNSICSQLASWLWFTVGFCSRFCQRNKVLNTEIISSVTNSLHHSQLICLLWYRNTLWKSKRQGRGGEREKKGENDRERERGREGAVCTTRRCSKTKDRNDDDRNSSEICKGYSFHTIIMNGTRKW